MHLAFLIVFDKIGKPTEQVSSEGPPVKLAGQLGKTQAEVWYNGDIRKTQRQRVRPQMF